MTISIIIIDDIILFLLSKIKFLILSFLLLEFIIDISSSISKSYYVKHIEVFHHFCNTQARFWYLFYKVL